MTGKYILYNDIIYQDQLLCLLPGTVLEVPASSITIDTISMSTIITIITTVRISITTTVIIIIGV